MDCRLGNAGFGLGYASGRRISKLLQSIVDTAKKPLAGYLVGVRRPGDSGITAREHLEELISLTQTYGVPVLGSEIVTLRDMNPTYLIGGGKAEEIFRTCEGLGADVIIFDDDLTPSQQRNWERLTKLAVIDRREVILGIFADRASTNEARLQVDLARAEYSLPRLTRAWTHLERQRGGGGVRGGAGEAQLEVDRRLVRRQIDRLKRDLKHVRQVRANQRRQRASEPVPQAAIVGYTNAGKSSLLNKLTGAGVLQEDKLFATLDPTTRKVQLPNNQVLLLTDTVGFIRKLPHTLVEAFKATLEEAQTASFLVHVVDASHPSALEQRRATEAVLEELEARQKPTILVLNKIDLVEDRSGLGQLAEGYDRVAAISTETGEGLEGLVELLEEFAAHKMLWVRLSVPADRHDVVSLMHREGRVDKIVHLPDSSTWIEGTVPKKFQRKVTEFLTLEIPDEANDDFNEPQGRDTDDDLALDEELADDQLDEATESGTAE
jgi:GTP-binding protein HflX